MHTIGRYQLLERLGQGGMGVVYRAHDTLLERTVAVKVISAPIDQNADLRERFFREARSAGQLSHRNIITIHDLGEHEGQPYLAMEFLEGHDLQERMVSPQKLSVRRKLDIAIDICEGLDYAHVHGVIHRDIKPANIFVTDNGMVKILDFGLARLVTSELTRSNMMMGTLNYMAPEQIRGERVDHRVDIFSAGVVLYELFGGKRAFEGDSFASTLYKILQESPTSLRELDPTLPVELIQIVERALAKPRDDRYQHTSDMLRELTLYRQQLTVLDSPAAGRSTPSELRRPSDVPTALTPAVPVPAVYTPTPLPAPVSAPASTPGERAVPTGLIVVAVLALGVAILAIWMTSRGTQPPPPPTTAAVPAPAEPSTSDVLQKALTAFEGEDYESAERQAESVLARDPGNEAARSLRDRARASKAAVAGGLEKARKLVAAGRFEEASRAAGEVLSVAPGNREAAAIMADGAARSRGRGAEEARSQVARAKASARSAGAHQLRAIVVQRSPGCRTRRAAPLGRRPPGRRHRQVLRSQRPLPQRRDCRPERGRVARGARARSTREARAAGRDGTGASGPRRDATADDRPGRQNRSSHRSQAYPRPRQSLSCRRHPRRSRLRRRQRLLQPGAPRHHQPRRLPKWLCASCWRNTRRPSRRAAWTR